MRSKAGAHTLFTAHAREENAFTATGLVTCCNMPKRRQPDAEPIASKMTSKRPETSCATLIKWCESHGAVLDGVELMEGEEGLSRGLVASKALQYGDCFLSIPHSLFLTVDVAMKSVVGGLIAGAPNLRVAANLEAERRRWDGTRMTPSI